MVAEVKGAWQRQAGNRAAAGGTWDEGWRTGRKWDEGVENCEEPGAGWR
jgi:hypothetical protein